MACALRMGRGAPRAARTERLSRAAGTAQIGAMRRRLLVLALVPLLPLAACAGGPQGLGITGPQGHPTAVEAPPPAADPLDAPDLLQSGSRYGPSTTPTTGGGHFWGYD
jgi:hypothetical protein